MKSFSLTSNVKGQHTVPRFLLNYFGYGNRKVKQLHTFDKQNNRIFTQSVKDASTRNRFYNFDSNIENASLESMLGVIENDVAPIFERIVAEESIKSLTKSEREIVSVFIVVQRARTFGSMQQLNELSKLFIDVLPEDENTNNRNTFLTSIIEQMKLTPYILNKNWVLYSTDTECSFYISDNPVTFHNHIKMEERGNLGLDVKGIQIHMPLTPTLSIAFLCPTVTDLFEKAAKQIEIIMKNEPDLLCKIKRPDSILDAAKHIKNGTPHKLEVQNVIFQNSLQVTFSEQYIFSSNNDFSLVQDIASDQGEIKTGPRYQ
jgi:hypothetical protein